MRFIEPKNYYPYVLHYKPGFMLLFLFAYILSYTLIIILGAVLSKGIVTLLFPFLLFVGFILLMIASNLFLRSRTSELYATGYYKGAMPTEVMVWFCDRVHELRKPEHLKAFLSMIFPEGVWQMHLEFINGCNHPSEFLYALMKGKNNFELDSIINHYLNESTKQNRRSEKPQGGQVAA